MPSTGTPSSKTTSGARGVSSSVTEFGPPERMMPRGLKSRMNCSLTSKGCSSQYTPASRTRRAISCAYCAPKSRMRILSCCISGLRIEDWGLREPRFCFQLNPHSSILFDVVVGCFLDDLHIVDVRFAHAGAGDLHELGAIPDFVDGRATEVTHRRTQPSHQLLHDLYDAALVGNTAFHTLGHQLVRAVFIVLEIAVAGTLLHRAQRSHAAVRLVRAPLE